MNLPPEHENCCCRIFELPEIYPIGGITVEIRMVIDWFNPWPDETMVENIPETWDEVVKLLMPFLKANNYLKDGRKYILITDFDEFFIFDKNKIYLNKTKNSMKIKAMDNKYIAILNNNEMKIKVMYHNSDIMRIEEIHKGDWIDLRCAEDVEMKAGDFKLISLGVSIELPSGYEAHVLPRSSTYKNFGIILANSQGIIDNSYKNSKDIWRFPAIAMRDTKINKNDRICQFRIVKNMEEVLIEEVNNLDHNEERGGFGSTGVK